jgi:hypothetical protein
MAKKIVPDWRLAINYYILGNILTVIPTVLFVRVVPLVVDNMWARAVIGLVGAAGLFYLGFSLSGAFISKRYIVSERKGIMKWAIGYLLFFDCLSWVVSYGKNFFGAASGVTALSIILFIGVLVKFAPRFLPISSKEEIDEAVLANPPKPKQPAARTGMVVWYVLAELGLDILMGGLLSLALGTSLEKAGWIKDLVMLFQSVVTVALAVWLFRATLLPKRFAWMAGISSAGLQAILFTIGVLVSGIKGISLLVTIFYLPLYLLAPVLMSWYSNKKSLTAKPSSNNS